MVVINWASLCLLKNFPGVIDTGCVLVACLVSVTKHLMKEGFILAQHLRVQSTLTQKVGWQKFEVAVYVLSTSGSREQCMLLLTPLLLIQSGTQQMEWCHLPLVNLIWQISDQHAHRFISLAILKPVKFSMQLRLYLWSFLLTQCGNDCISPPPPSCTTSSASSQTGRQRQHPQAGTWLYFSLKLGSLN